VGQSGADIGRLSSREMEIVLSLLDGQRVPAIAQRLFLSQSTVRNHLASVFRKLRVSSQQELINLLKRDQSSTRR
jgi:DNA-binding NarL/FixJ family response regulator